MVLPLRFPTPATAIGLVGGDFPSPPTRPLFRRNEPLIPEQLGRASLGFGVGCRSCAPVFQLVVFLGFIGGWCAPEDPPTPPDRLQARAPLPSCRVRDAGSRASGRRQQAADSAQNPRLRGNQPAEPTFHGDHRVCAVHRCSLPSGCERSIRSGRCRRPPARLPLGNRTNGRCAPPADRLDSPTVHVIDFPCLFAFGPERT